MVIQNILRILLPNTLLNGRFKRQNSHYLMVVNYIQSGAKFENIFQLCK